MCDLSGFVTMDTKSLLFSDTKKFHGVNAVMSMTLAGDAPAVHQCVFSTGFLWKRSFLGAH